MVKVVLLPLFVRADDPAQGVREWTIGLEDLPPLTGSDKQVRWATAIRDTALRAFVQAAAGTGDDALLKRHWYTDEVEVGREAMQEALTRRLGPMLAWATPSPLWINARGLATLGNAETVANLLFQHDQGGSDV